MMPQILYTQSSYCISCNSLTSNCCFTCSELNIVKIQAKAVVLILTVRIPKAQVSPRRGNRTMEAVKMALYSKQNMIGDVLLEQ